MGLVLCAAQGHEYIQFHRPFRQLAIQLSEAGCAVLRFDFSGCGDSEGNQEGWSLEGWRDDVAVAIEELKQRVRTTRVGLVGLRLGATLAMQVAETRDDIDAVVVWDPVVDGSAYLTSSRPTTTAAATRRCSASRFPGHSPPSWTVSICSARRDLLPSAYS